MRKEIVSYAYGSFNDFKGNMHRIIVCSISNKKCESYAVDYNEENDEEEYINLAKSLSIGVAICNPLDDYDEPKGEMMAYGRAKSQDSIKMYATKAGMFNTQTVTAIMNNYLDYIKRDPGSIIKGYDESKKKYQEKIDLLDDIRRMSDEDKVKMSILANSTNESIEYAKKVAKLL